MELTYLNRRARLIWPGRPFESLGPFTIEVATTLRSGHGGDPCLKQSNTWMHDDTDVDVIIGYGKIGIEEFSEGNIWAGAGPIYVVGKDKKTKYKVSFASFVNRMLAEQEEITIEANWNVAALV